MNLSESFWAYLRRRVGDLGPGEAEIVWLAILGRRNLKIERRSALLTGNPLDRVANEIVRTFERNQIRH